VNSVTVAEVIYEVII